MTTPSLARLLLARPLESEPDTDLLARYAAGRDEAAFAALVRRHGPMVLSVARRAVRDPSLADDVAQAVFLVLARKAGRLARPDRLAGWLFGVTRRAARRAEGRRLRDVPLTTDVPGPAPRSPDWADLLAVLDQELGRLPEAERAALVLCYLEGLTQDEAARACGWSVRTLRRRLAAGRVRLRARLERRGLGLGAALAGLAAVPESALGGLIRAVADGLASHPRPAVAGLTRAELRPPLLIRVGPAVALTAVLVGLAVRSPAQPTPPPGGGDPPKAPPAAPEAAPDLPAGAVLQLGSTALRHPGRPTDLRFSADGRQLVSYGDGKVRRWDARTGAAVRPAAPPAEVDTTFGTSLLSPDGARVIAPHVDHNPLRFSVREYDLATGRHKELFVIPPRTDPDGKPRGIGGEKFALSPDDTLLAEGHSDEVYVWDLAGGRVRHHLKGAVGWRMAFLPDGSRLATAGGPGVGPRLWDLKTGKEAAALAWDKPSTAGVGGLAVSPNGRWLAATENVHLLGTGTRLVVWDLTGPNPPRAITLPETTSSGGALVFGPDGRTLFVVAPGKPRSAVSQWDVAEGKRLAQWAGPYLEHFPAAAVSPDGGTLAVGSLTGVIHLYQTRTGKEVVRPTGHAAPVAAVEYLRAAVQTVGADGTAASWDPATGAQKGNLTLAAADRTGDELARVAMGGPWVLTRVENRAGLRTEPPFILALWDGATGERKHTWIVDGHTTAIGLGRDGRFAVAQLEGRGFRVWDTATGNEIADIFRPHRNWAARFTVLPDGKTLVVCDEVEADGFDLATGKRVFGWKLADHDVLGRPLPAEDQRPGLVRALAASPDGKTLAIQVGGEWFIDPARRPHNLVLVEARTGKVLRRVQTPDTPAEALVFSPNGKCLAGTWCVWEAATLGEAFRFPALLKVTAFGFSPDSRRVATGLADGTTLVWEVEGRK